MGVELQILDAIQTIRTPFLDAVMPWISNGVMLWILLAAVLILRSKTRRAGWMMAAAIVLDIVICNIVMKNAFHRIRPCDVNTAVTLLIPRPTDYSFPSGHTALSFAAVTSLWLSGALKKWRIPALVFACLIAFSRLYLYVHYPTDILMGMAAGAFCGWLAYRLVRAREAERYPQKRAAA